MQGDKEEHYSIICLSAPGAQHLLARTVKTDCILLWDLAHGLLVGLLTIQLPYQFIYIVNSWLEYK